MSESPPWQGDVISPEPPDRVTHVRAVEDKEAVRGGPCDECGGSLWAWITPGGQPRSAWVCWMDLDGIGPFLEVRP